MDEINKKLPMFLERDSLEKVKERVDKGLMRECEGILGEPKGSVNTVLNNLYTVCSEEFC